MLGIVQTYLSGGGSKCREYRTEGILDASLEVDYKGIQMQKKHGQLPDNAEPLGAEDGGQAEVKLTFRKVCP